LTRLKAREVAALSEKIPCSTEQGILISDQGIEIPCSSFDQGTGPAYQNLRFRDLGRSSRVLRSTPKRLDNYERHTAIGLSSPS
jgi:hypothetical protein